MITSAEQEEICTQYKVIADVPNSESKLGIALETLNNAPLNGLRHPEEAGTCGWYIFGGEVFPEADDAFSPLHVAHLTAYCPVAIRFLALPPGWRFLIDGDYCDVWYDASLFDI